METKTKLKNYSKIIIFFFCLLLIINSSYSQKCDGNQIAITVENVIITSTTSLEFDVLITNTGSTALSLAAIQGGVIYNKELIENDAQIIFSVSNETSDFKRFNAITTKISKATNQLRWIQNPVGLSSGKTVNLPYQKKMKFARFKLTSSLPLKTNLPDLLIPQYNVKAGYTDILATVYCNNNFDSIGLKSIQSQLNNNSTENLNAFALPNPYSENFHLEMQTSIDAPIQIKVYDMLGKLIENKTIEVGNLNSTTIGSNYPTGIYSIAITQKEKTQTIRIIKK